MSRLSIEIPSGQHQQIKAMAAFYGQSVRDYIIGKALPPMETSEPYSEEELVALEQLEAFLAPRIAAAKRGEFSSLTGDEIIAKAQKIYAAKS